MLNIHHPFRDLILQSSTRMLPLTSQGLHPPPLCGISAIWIQLQGGLWFAVSNHRNPHPLLMTALRIQRSFHDFPLEPVIGSVLNLIAPLMQSDWGRTLFQDWESSTLRFSLLLKKGACSLFYCWKLPSSQKVGEKKESRSLMILLTWLINLQWCLLFSGRPLIGTNTFSSWLSGSCF